MPLVAPTRVVIRQDHTAEAIHQRPRATEVNYGQKYGTNPVIDDEEQESDASISQNQSRAQSLPLEVLIHIFSQLGPADIDNAALVCRHWYRAADDASWRASFARHFAVTKFNRVTASLKWRTEFMSRLDYLHRWHKGHCNNLSFNCSVWDITHVFSDFEALRILALNLRRGIAVVADPTRGKVANQRVFTDKSLQPTPDAISVDGGRHGVVWGVIGGRVMLVLFSHETRLRDYITLHGFHFDNTTAVWINKLEAPRTTSRIPVLSGGSDGHVFLWNVKTGAIDKDFEVSQDVPIVQLKCDSKERVVCMNSHGEVFHFDRRVDDEFRKVGEIPLQEGALVLFFEADFTSDYAVCAVPSGVYRIRLSVVATQSQVQSVAASTTSSVVASPLPPSSAGFQSPHRSPLLLASDRGPVPPITMTPEGSGEGTGHAAVTRFSTAPDIGGKIVAASMDCTIFPQGRVSGDAPGSGARYVAAASDHNLIYVWDLQREPTPPDNGEIPALRVQDSPFQLSDNSLPGVTAVALNSLVLLLGSYNGVTVALDLLTGDFLRVVSARFSKRALNFRAEGDAAGMWPVTHLELDSDPASPHGIIVVRSAVQYFDLGASYDKSSIKKKGVHKKPPLPYTGGAIQSGATSRGQIEQDIEQELMLMDNEEEEEDEELSEIRHERRRRSFVENMSEEEQLRYAMMLSQNQDRSRPQSQEMEEEEFRRALELSAAEEHNTEQRPAQADDEAADEAADEELRRALELSAAEGQRDIPQAQEAEEEELRRALELSAAEKEKETFLSQLSEEQQIEYAMKLSQDATANEDPSEKQSIIPPSGAENDDELDEDMKLAIRLSLQEGQ